MTDARLQSELEESKQEIRRLRERLSLGTPTVHKDMSLVSLVPKCSGTETAVLLDEFFASVDGAAQIGRWEQSDCVRIAVLKIADAARSFYNGCPELHTEEVTWQRFKNVFKCVRTFLGLCSFYRKLIPKFAEIAKPLTMLTRKDQKFTWGLSQQVAFEELKNRLCTTPVLAYPNFELPITLTTDASKVAVAAILSQVQDGTERVTAYASRQMNRAEQAYTSSEMEMLALV